MLIRLMIMDTNFQFILSNFFILEKNSNIYSNIYLSIFHYNLVKHFNTINFNPYYRQMNRLVVRVPFKSRTPGIFYRSIYSYLQPEKHIDMKKPAIKLMLQPYKQNFNIEILKYGKLCSRNLITKLYYLNSSDLSLGYLCSIFTKVTPNIMESQNGMKIFLNKFLSTYHTMNETLQLHKENNLVHLLNSIETIEDHSHHDITRGFLAFLATYFLKNPQLKTEQKNMIVQFLASRSYLFEEMRKYIRNIQVDDTKLDEMIRDADPIQLKEYFEDICHILSTVLQMENIKSSQNKETIVKAQQKQKLINIYFRMLQNKQILPFLLNPTRPELLFLNNLFEDEKNRQRFITIFLRIFTPTVFCNYRTYQNLELFIFDRLFKYYRMEDRPQIIKVLQSYKQSQSVKVSMKAANRINFGTLIHLCEKYKYFCDGLMKIIVKKYLQLGVIFGEFHQTPNIFREKILIKNSCLLFQSQLTSIMNILHENNLPIPKQFIQTFKKHLYNNFEYTLDLIGLSILLKQNNIEQVRKTYEKSFKYLKYYELQYTSSQVQEWKQKTQEIERKYRIQCDEEILMKYSYPLNLILHQGVKLKLLFQVLNYYCQIAENGFYTDKLFKKINFTYNLSNMIKNYICYPGLLKQFYLFYQIHYFRFKNPLSSQILESLQSQRAKISKKLISMIKGNENESKKTKIQQLYNIEHLNKPIKVLPNYYSIQFQNMSIYEKEIQQLTQNKQMRETFKKFLFTFAKEHPNKFNISFPHIEYPFMADFLILTFDQRIVVLIVPSRQPDEGKAINDDKKTQKTKIFKSHNQINQTYFIRNNKVVLISSPEDIENFKEMLTEIVSK